MGGTGVGVAPAGPIVLIVPASCFASCLVVAPLGSLGQTVPYDKVLPGLRPSVLVRARWGSLGDCPLTTRVLPACDEGRYEVAPGCGAGLAATRWPPAAAFFGPWSLFVIQRACHNRRPRFSAWGYSWWARANHDGWVPDDRVSHDDRDEVGRSDPLDAENVDEGHGHARIFRLGTQFLWW